MSSIHSLLSRKGFAIYVSNVIELISCCLHILMRDKFLQFNVKNALDVPFLSPLKIFYY